MIASLVDAGEIEPNARKQRETGSGFARGQKRFFEPAHFSQLLHEGGVCVPEVGTLAHGNSQGCEQFLRLEDRVRQFAKTKQAITEHDLVNQLVLDESQRLLPFGMRLAKVNQAADGVADIDRKANRFAIFFPGFIRAASQRENATGRAARVRIVGLEIAR
jgi:hypothetical protein